jgi:hypothetical protein
MPGQVYADVWLQIAPKRSKYGRREIEGARAVKLSQKKPEVTDSGCVLVKLRLILPRDIFTPPVPSADIVIPESLVQELQTIQVTALDAKE